MTEENLDVLASLLSSVVVIHQKLGMPKQFFMDALSAAWDLGAGITTVDEAREQMRERHPVIMGEKVH